MYFASAVEFLRQEGIRSQAEYFELIMSLSQSVQLQTKLEKPKLGDITVHRFIGYLSVTNHLHSPRKEFQMLEYP